MKSLKFALALIPFALVGGYFTGSYAYASYTPEVQQQLMEQLGSSQLLMLTAAVQSAVLAFICGLLGCMLANRVGLMKPVRFERAPLKTSLLVTVICGLLFSMDYWVFGALLPEVAAQYDGSLLIGRFDNWMASIFYGGIVEEVLMRLFVMSLFSFVIWKLFFRKTEKENIPAAVFVSANLLSALLFAAGHLPATVGMFGTLSPLILLRCFLLNGGLGLVFGRLYRTYGIQYAMLSHMGCHILSKLIWTVCL